MRAPVFIATRLVEGLRVYAHAWSSAPREQERRLAQSAILNLIATALLAVAASQGLASWLAIGVTMGLAWSGQFIFFMLVRSGWSERRADPTLSFEQLMFAVVIVVLSYGLIEIARGSALELLCLLLAFGMERLSTRQLFKASISAVALLALTSLARIAIGEGRDQVHAEIYNLLMAAVLLPVAIITGGEISRLYERQAVQREQLASTLGRLTELSMRDALTGLTNRRQILRMIEQTHLEVLATKAGYCVAMLDIDWFKRVNDDHGHAVGDAVLKEFASLMAASLDRRFTLARWGGEEFLLLMPCCTLLESQSALSACRRTLSAHDWTALAPGLCITFSAGVAGSISGETIDDTLQRADRSLYVAKGNGRNRTEVCVDSAAGANCAAIATLQPLRQTNGSLQSPVCSVDAIKRQVGFSRASDFAGENAAAEHRPSTPWAKLKGAVLSTSPKIREHLRLPLIALVLHTVWLAAVYFYAMPTGQIAVQAGWIVIVYESASALGFYAAIRSGWSLRFEDGGLILAQMLAASAIASFGYVVAPELRPSLLHLLCVIQVFGMVTLKPAETKLAGVAAAGLLCTVMLYLVRTQPADLNSEVLKLVLACSILLQLSLLSHSYSTVRRRVGEQRIELEQAVTEVQDQVTRDPLTGMVNRRYMEEALAQHYAAWSKGGEDFCLGILDIDHFKRINDAKGHHAGDAVLVALAQASRQTLRESDLICRWGGEEFVWMLRGSATDASSRATMQRLRSAFAQTSSATVGADIIVTFSSGFTYPCQDVKLDDLLAQADRALYRAKQTGRDRDVCWSDIQDSHSASVN